jgi:hypothetical protein
MNVHSPQEVMEAFFPDVERHSILIFHCELSKNRGPTQAQKFREIDRKLNESRYPVLFYPDVYVLEGGYREYYASFPGDCVGGYVPMHSEEDLRSGLAARETSEWRLGLEDYARWKSEPLRRCLEDRLFFWLEHQKRELEKEREEIAQTEAEDSRLKELSEPCEPERCEEGDWMVLEGEFQMLMSPMEPRTLRFVDEKEREEEEEEEAEEGEDVLEWEPNVVRRQEEFLPRLLCFEDEEEGD